MRQLLLFMILVLATLIALFASVCSASVIVVIGPSAHEHFKYTVIGKFLSEPKKVTENEDGRHFTVWSRIKSVTPFDNAFIRTLHFPTLNVSTVMFSKLSADEMSLDHLQIFFDIIKTDKDLVVVEIGDETVQSRALLDKAVLCWGKTKLQIDVPHRVYLCNNIKPTDIPGLSMTEIDNISRNFAIQIEQPKPFWPCLFASAINTSRRPVKEEVEVEDDDDEDEFNDNDNKNENGQEDNDSEEKSSMDDEGDDNEEVKKIELTKDAIQNKLTCKYRTSCYETGLVPKIENFWGFSATEDAIEIANEEDDGEDADENDYDVASLKLRCKYRYKCYRENNIPISDKTGEKDISFFSGKISTPQGKKRTIKEIAERTIERVKAREEEAADREIPASIVVEKKLNEIEEKMKQKLKCKYRISCYASGIVPDIEKSSLSLFLHSSDSEKKEKEIPFEERDELDKKTFCKYRKSCYETGERPVIERVESFASLEDIAEIETRKITVQEKCKYRKSCYETGIAPDLSPPIVVSKKEMESAIPTSMASLKEFCKYRKSCYESVALSDGVSTIKKIRQTRLLEKETKKRHKHRKHRKYRLATIGEGYFRKETRKEKLAERMEKIRREEVKNSLKTEKPSKETTKDIKQKKRSDLSKEDKPAEAKKIEDQPVNETKQKAERKIKSVRKGKKRVKPEKVTVEEILQTADVHTTVESGKKISKKSKKREPTKQKLSKVAAEDDTHTEGDDTDDCKQDFEDNKPREKISMEKKPIVTESMKESLFEENLDEDNSVEHEENMITNKWKKNLSKKQEQNEGEDAATTADGRTAMEMRKTEHENMPREGKRQGGKESVDDFNSDEFESKKQQRELCKYRKSCYESGKLPEISRSYADVIKDIHTHVENQYQSELEMHFKEEDKKLKCKYRKSCYDTGVLPEIISFSEFSESRAPSFAEELSIQMKCKYRKSCYEKHGLKMEDVEDHETPPTEATKKEKVVEKKIAAAESEETDKKRKDKQKHDDDIDENERMDSDVEEMTGDHLDVYGKLSCKYRRSCYATTPPRATREDHSNTMARQGQKNFIQERPLPHVLVLL